MRITKPLVIFADVHYERKLRAGRDTQLLCERAIKYVFRYATKINADVVLLGDLFDKSNPHTDVLLRFNYFMECIGDSFSNTCFVISANHELTPEDNSVLELVHWPNNFKVIIDEVFTVTHSKFGIIHLVPYLHNKYLEVLHGLKRDAILMSHVLVDGSTGRVRLSSDVYAKHFKKFKAVVLGDVHKRQKIAGNIYYCGNLVQRDGRDYGNPQGFIVMTGDSANISIKWVTLPSDRIPEVQYEAVDKESSDRLADILSVEVPVMASLNEQEAFQVIKRFVLKNFSSNSQSTVYLNSLKTKLGV